MLSIRRSGVWLAAAAASLLGPSLAQADLVLPRVSPKATVTQTIGVTDLTVSYCRPGVKERVIWGGLVPYDEVWRTGANEATTLTTTDAITVAGKPLAAGSYAVLTIPTAKDWTVILSPQTDLRGTQGYDPAKDVLRVTVTPTAAEAAEWLRFSFENLTAGSADLVMRWEKLAVAVPIAVDVNAVVLPKARTEVAAAKADDWQTPFRAASYCFDANVNLEEAAKWLDKSIQVKGTNSNLGLKARWLAKDGKTKEAVDTGKKAIEAGKKNDPPSDTSAMEKLVAEWTAQM